MSLDCWSLKIAFCNFTGVGYEFQQAAAQTGISASTLVARRRFLRAKFLLRRKPKVERLMRWILWHRSIDLHNCNAPKQQFSARVFTSTLHLAYRVETRRPTWSGSTLDISHHYDA